MKIKEIGTVVTGKTPSTKKRDYFIGILPFITPEDISKGYVIKDSIRHLSEEGFNSIKNNTLDGTSVMVGCIGSDMGNVAIFQGRCSTNQQINSITRFSDVANPFYVYYFLSTRKQYLRSIAGSTATPLLPKSNFEEIDIPLPTRKCQDKVASVLRDIDEKIANNNASCSDLEAMAKLLYDYWFVQFDFPDENGKPYKSSGGKMVWNEELKKEIPEGWEVDSLYHIADFINGLACQKFRPVDIQHKLPVIKITEMHNGITDNTEYVRDDIDESHIIDNGDILFSWSASLEVMIWNGGRGGLNQHIFKVVPKVLSKNYVYMQLSSYVVNFVKMAEARKTTMGHITSDHLAQSRIAIPRDYVLTAFQKCTKSIFEQLTTLNVENEQLSSLRDFLLPMLMNGQVKIKEGA